MARCISVVVDSYMRCVWQYMGMCCLLLISVLMIFLFRCPKVEIIFYLRLGFVRFIKYVCDQVGPHPGFFGRHFSMRDSTYLHVDSTCLHGDSKL